MQGHQAIETSDCGGGDLHHTEDATETRRAWGYETEIREGGVIIQRWVNRETSVP